MKNIFQNSIILNKTLITTPLFKWFSIVFTTTCIEYLVFIFGIGGFGPNILANYIKCIGDIAFIFAFYWLLSFSAKWLYIVIQWLLSFFFMANSWHIKFFNEMLSPLAYKLTNNLNQTLLHSIGDLISLSDIIFILSPIATTFCYFFYFKQRIRKNPNKVPIITRLLCFTSCILLWILAQAAFIITERKQDFQAWGYTRYSLGDTIKFRNPFNIYEKSAVLGEFRLEGLILYLTRSFTMVIDDIIHRGGKISLKKSDVDYISSYIKQVPSTGFDSCFYSNKDKNLIIILVESLNSYMIGKKLGNRELTPVMNMLATATGSITSLSMRTLVADGISNDGQLIINTGLLPTKQGVVMGSFGGSNTFPSIVKCLMNHSNAVIFGDNGQTWNQTGCFKNFGFLNIYSELDFKKQAESKGNDAAMFEMGRKIIPELKKPFFMEFISFSTHTPFKDNGVKMPQWIKNASGLEQHEKNYYSMINYFDTQLGTFIDYLKSHDLWLNTVLIITSDHSILYALNKQEKECGLFKEFFDIPIAFIAANTGLTRNITHITSQANIFPTILQIMNHKGIYGYHGLDRSLLDLHPSAVISPSGTICGNPPTKEIERMRQAYKVSEIINRGNYFGLISDTIKIHQVSQ